MNHDKFGQKQSTRTISRQDNRSQGNEKKSYDQFNKMMVKSRVVTLVDVYGVSMNSLSKCTKKTHFSYA